MYNITTLRGTIFCAPIRYSREFVESLSEKMEGYVPMLVRDNGVLPMIFTGWQLISPDEKEFLIFNGEKIDLVKQVGGELDNEGLTAFVERCREVLGKIMEVTGNICKRVAFAPSVIVTENGSRPTELFRRLYSIQEFDGVQLESSNLSQVYRVDKEIEGRGVRINHVANFYAGNGIVGSQECYMCDFDINTMGTPDSKFTVVGINDFFDMAPKCFEKFYELYFK